MHTRLMGSRPYSLFFTLFINPGLNLKDTAEKKNNKKTPN